MKRPHDAATELARVINGSLELTAAGIAILIDVHPTAVQNWMRLHPDAKPHDLPAGWQQSGRRRSNEAQAHTGSLNVTDALAYWADRDLGMDVELDPETGGLWLINETPADGGGPA
ncbi:hypothetical protein [Mycolicibacterium gadium]|uniref:Uncharacterized protein n=1 Tax=Mycolicibacterium gadium TaxID=1794 RepID=A0A7I7WHB4_MYCGU|nr:hypothetical protein [Mycolicibacterium gadium]BBZ17079.1 hypothetical protein MGAD_14140 [Mycolicibacterium gadium]